MSFSEELIDHGHEVYAILPVTYSKGPSLLTHRVKPLFFKTDPDLPSIDDIIVDVFGDTFQCMLDVSNLVTHFCRAMIEDNDLRKEIEELKFDVAVVDGFVLNYCNFLLPYMHGIPFVYMFGSLHPWVAGGPGLPSFRSIGEIHGFLPLSDRMSLWERITNLYWYVILSNPPFPGRQDVSLLREYTPEIQTWDVLVSKSALFIETRDHILQWPSPVMPHHIQTPGVTNKPAKPLPEELNKIITAADKDVIIVSFGSLAAQFPKDITDKLIQTFNQFDETIIWRFSGSLFEYVKSNVKPNIHILSWIPQNDLLKKVIDDLLAVRNNIDDLRFVCVIPKFDLYN